MKYTDWQKLHINTYKNYMQQRYGKDMEIAVNRLDKIVEIRDEDQFDNELIKLTQQE